MFSREGGEESFLGPWEIWEKDSQASTEVKELKGGGKRAGAANGGNKGQPTTKMLSEGHPIPMWVKKLISTK